MIQAPASPPFWTPEIQDAFDPKADIDIPVMILGIDAWKGEPTPRATAKPANDSRGPFQKFEDAMRQILSVPKKAIAVKLTHKRSHRSKR